MPRKSDEQRKYYVSNIRKLLSIDRNMPLREIQHQLEENGLRLDLDYINALREKIFEERRHRTDRKLLSEALSSFEDVLNETTKIAWQIALSNQSTRKERIAALKEIREAHSSVFDKMFDSGIFERKVGVVEHRHVLPLSLEQITNMIETLIPWGIVKENEKHDQLPEPKPADTDQKPS